MTTRNNKYCSKCTVRIPKHRPRLVCCICNTIKHLRCQSLSKNDALSIINLNTDWICKECVSEILPINACADNKRNTYKVRCHSCNGFSHSQNSTRVCCYCNFTVHEKCHNKSLGCIKCCVSMIPGYHATSYELNND